MVGVSNQSTSKNSHVSDPSKLDTLLHKTHTNILRLGMCTSMISLSKMTHHRVSQILCLHGGTDPPVRGDHEQVMRGDKILWGGTLA